jgi:riboflavin synthase
MFSGIISDMGTIMATAPRGHGRTFEIRTGFPVGGEDGIGLGDSIAVNGVCLTAEAISEPDRFTVALGKETLDCTTMGRVETGDRVHLERALAVGDRLDGHIVSGHVDGVGTLTEITEIKESYVLWITAPDDLAKYIAPKGSVTVDGVSLTVNEVNQSAFRVNIIPFTAEHTTLARHTPGGEVNLEVDLIARYLERMLGVDGAGLAERVAALGIDGGKKS